MTLEIRLLGNPSAQLDGTPVALRGQKGWLLLAVLLLSKEPLTRDRLGGLLFSDAADPAGALRWNLSQLRRALEIELGGDPVTLSLPSGTEVDVLTLASGDALEGSRLPGLDEDLLAGLRGDASAGLDAWLAAERRHVRTLVSSVRHEAALSLLGRGDSESALELARRVLAAAPLDENAAALLVRCLRAAGRPHEAREIASETGDRIRTELGLEPTAALWSALAAPPGGDRRASGRGAVLAQLEMGRASVAAGAVDPGLEALRSAVVAARALSDPALLARCLVELGSALIHGVRGVDQDGLALLHEALPLTEEAGEAALASLARREIGYVDMLRARYERALRWFGEARQAADGDLAEQSWSMLYEGAARSDIGDRAGADQAFDEVLDGALGLRDFKLEAFVRSFRGRQATLEGELDTAVDELEQAASTARSVGWTGFLGFPESLLADAIRARGELARAQDVGERALAVGEQVADPCWESLALRSLGLVAVDQGHVQKGVELLEEAPLRCRRLPDTYLWIEVYGLDALARVGAHRGLPQADRWVAELDDMAGNYGIRPLHDRALAYRGG